MPNFAVQFKSEISRIAKKEARSETKTLKRSSAHYRSEIAELKRRLAAVESALKKAAKQSSRSDASASTPADEASTALRFRSGGFASLRKKLGLSATDMGKLIGVSGPTVYNWEAGKSRPRPSQLEAISAVRKMGKREAATMLSGRPKDSKTPG